ncbi:MAG: M1 family metallopeptidase [Gammaproteobacteria bacterium]|nr:M1 family metallopeptidase [Gammaproteobacteria bacterium]
MPHYCPRFSSIVLLASVLIASCSRSGPETPAVPAAGETATTDVMANDDWHSYANTDEYRLDHLELDLSVDFADKVIAGVATLRLDVIGNGSEDLVLDTRDLLIEKVHVGGNGEVGAGNETRFSLGDASDSRGQPLTIAMPGDADTVTIRYRTSPSASGVQWLEPQQTAGKRHPFLFTQAQAIHARSFVPLQDTPGVRFTYNATVRTPVELRAVMSANNDPDAEQNGVYSFSMPQRIPSYLLALAVGDLEFKPMGPRTGVYAEREILDAAAAEFADTEAMLETTEEVYGPYRWDRYDLLILPPSFPFGGMENPRLSFITPTVIAGDKSLVALIAHELAHSWSGNLVTNSSWRDLWLNEGFTTYLTNRIMQFVYGDNRYRMEMALGFADLQADLAKLDGEDQLLAQDVEGRDPDEAFSNIPYEKGSLFLYELEQKVGRDAFDEFLLDYFNRFAFQSISTERFLDHLDQTLLKTHGEDLDEARIRQWIFQPGVPAGAPRPESDAFQVVDAARASWLDGSLPADRLDSADWTYHQWKHFLDGMPEALSAAQLTELDAAFDLTESTNNEIAFSWLRIAVRNDYEPAYPRLESFLTSIGRNKFLRPLYQDLMDNGKAAWAAEIFESARPGYHPLTVKRNSQIVYPDR